MRSIRTERAFPIKGIREDLPAGERVLWQGAPAWRDLALTAFHVRKVALYFGVLLALRATLLLADGATVADALRSTLPMVVLAAAGVALLAGLALWSARTTIYAVTTQRVVMRVGMALPIVINLPFTGIQSARLAQRRNGCGDLPLVLQGNVHLAYVHLWPYVRPWRLATTEPMLRAVPEAALVAQLLARALATSGGTALAAAPLPAQPAATVGRGVAPEAAWT